MPKPWKRWEPNLAESCRFIEAELSRLEKFDNEHGAEGSNLSPEKIVEGHRDAWRVIERAARKGDPENPVVNIPQGKGPVSLELATAIERTIPSALEVQNALEFTRQEFARVCTLHRTVSGLTNLNMTAEQVEEYQAVHFGVLVEAVTGLMRQLCGNLLSTPQSRCAPKSPGDPNHR